MPSEHFDLSEISNVCLPPVPPVGSGIVAGALPQAKDCAQRSDFARIVLAAFSADLTETAIGQIFQMFSASSLEDKQTLQCMLLTRLSAAGLPLQLLLTLRLMPLVARSLQQQDIALMDQVVCAAVERVTDFWADQIRQAGATTLLLVLAYCPDSLVQDLAFGIYLNYGSAVDGSLNALVEHSFSLYAKRLASPQEIGSRVEQCLARKRFLESEILLTRDQSIDSGECADVDESLGPSIDQMEDNVSSLSIEQILSVFNEWLCSSAMKRSSKRVYASRLEKFAQFVLSQNVMMQEPIDDESLSLIAQEFVVSLREEELTDQTVNNFITLLRIMARITGFEGLKLAKKKIERAASRTSLKERDLERLLQIVRVSGARNKFLLLLCLRANVRLRDCVDIRLCDLVQTSCGPIELTLRAPHRKVQLAGELKESLDECLAEHPLKGDVSANLFCGSAGKPLTRSALDMIIRKVGWKAGLVICSRLLRNSYLSNLG